MLKTKKRTWLLAVTSASLMLPACGGREEGWGDVTSPVDGTPDGGDRPIGESAAPIDAGHAGDAAADAGNPPMGAIALPADGGDAGDGG